MTKRIGGLTVGENVIGLTVGEYFSECPETEAVKKAQESLERAEMLKRIHQEQMLADKYTQEKAAEQRQQERKRLFQEVALRTITERTRSDGYAYFDWDHTEVAQITNEILDASEDFAKEIE